METVVDAIQKTPIPTILIWAGLIFLLLGFVTKIGGFIEVSPEQKRLTIPIGLLVLTIGLTLNFIPTPSSNNVAGEATKPYSTPESSTDPTVSLTPVLNILSFRDWEGSWNLKWEYDGQWFGKTMKLSSNQSGITGDYELGMINGGFVDGDVSKVSGEYINTSGTGADCPSGKQSGRFSFTLAKDGKSIDGWWDVCGDAKRRIWKADKMESR